MPTLIKFQQTEFIQFTQSFIHTNKLFPKNVYFPKPQPFLEDLEDFKKTCRTKRKTDEEKKNTSTK